VSGFFDFLKDRIAAAAVRTRRRRRDCALFRALNHDGLRSEDAALLDRPDVLFTGARSASCMSASARGVRIPGPRAAVRAHAGLGDALVPQ
jgi:hypothetical protein